MNEEENKKNNRSIIIAVAFIVFALAFFFLMDYFQKQSLLKNGIRANATVTARYYEVSNKGDTSGYSMRLSVIADTGSAGSLSSGDILSAFVKKKSFYKYEEGTVVKVVYKKEDADRARLVEEIE